MGFNMFMHLIFVFLYVYCIPKWQAGICMITIYILWSRSCLSLILRVTHFVTIIIRPTKVYIGARSQSEGTHMLFDVFQCM